MALTTTTVLDLPVQTSLSGAEQIPLTSTASSSTAVTRRVALSLINSYPTGTTQTANTVFAGPTSGSAVAPAFRALVNADISPAGAALTKTDDTNVTLTLGGTPTTALVNAASLTLGWTGTLGVARGGTNLASYAVGDILYASGATTLAKLADVATGNALISGGVTTAPSWGKITLTGHVSGVLPVANGGTNASSASITAFNNITGYTAAGATGTTSTNLVFSTSPILVTPTLGVADATSLTATNIGAGGAISSTTWLNLAAGTTAASALRFIQGVAPTAPVDGDMWREDNTRTGLKLRVNSATKTVSLYESGSWTPSVSFATPGNLSVTYSAQTGAYVRIGNIVFVTALIRCSVFTHTTAASFFTITGLPFTPATNFVGAGTINMTYAKAGYTSLGLETGTNLFYVLASGPSAGASTELVAADVVSGTDPAIYLAGFYQI